MEGGETRGKNPSSGSSVISDHEGCGDKKPASQEGKRGSLHRTTPEVLKSKDFLRDRREKKE